MTMVSAFLLKDLVLLVVSVYLLKQDVARVLEARSSADRRNTARVSQADRVTA
jgi:hypothetical protein